MKRSQTLASVFTLAFSGAALLAGCGGDTTTTNSNAAGSTTGTTVNRNGLVETGVNGNVNPNTVSSNVAVVVNNNGNTGTAGISTVNGNSAMGGNTNSAIRNTNMRP